MARIDGKEVSVRWLGEKQSKTQAIVTTALLLPAYTAYRLWQVAHAPPSGFAIGGLVGLVLANIVAVVLLVRQLGRNDDEGSAGR